jgi:hypothetical protein
VVHLMDALRKSVEAQGGAAATPKRAAQTRRTAKKASGRTKQRKAG